MLKYKKNWTNESLGETFIRLLTFQSDDVGEILLYKDYYADKNLAREKRDYYRDIVQLGGYTPIWCISPAPIETVTNNRFSVYDLKNAEIFQHARCEMSLKDNDGLKDFTMIEFEISANLIYRGITHSVHELVYIAPYIKKEAVVGIYKLEYDLSQTYGWYYPTVHPIVLFKEDACFTESVKCSK